jgi:hypothetical protein
MPLRDLPATCGDCGGVLHEIKLFARSRVNPLSGAADDCDLLFGSPKTTRSSLLFMYEAEGSVHSLRCEACGRISLYGVRDDDATLKAEVIECLECGARIEAEQQSCPQCGWSYR